ncbi:MAG: hypothetical protein VX733_04410 [Candidatus Latescibacterota bacterium]|nr:hypothetical protein [Candidatus Latescibacterota bacterium]
MNRSIAGMALVAAMLGAVSATENRESIDGGVYDKPYLRSGWEGTVLGGYIDHELFWNDNKKTFDQHRYIPFIHGEVSDRIHVAAEIEFEHGGSVKGSGASDGEVKLEFATVDIQFHEGLTYRSGVILSPLGKFNLIHDSPLNDLTNRPLVAREIIPTTLSESGMGIHGVFYPGEEALVGYELYVVNGFNEATGGRIRSGRGSHKSDNNEEKSLVGRLNYSPFLGFDLGGSFHTGAYNDAGDESLTIIAGDVSWNRGPFDVRTEYATASIDGVDADTRSGYYVQVGYHFLPGVVDAFPNSILTGTFRYDHIDLEVSDETRYTFGLNFRLEEETVVKLDWEVYDQADANNGLILSVASYF